MGKVTDKDIQLKTFFEKSMGFVIRKAAFTRGTLMYYMYSKEHDKNIFFEQKPDTSMSCTIEGVTRNIPTKDVVFHAQWQADIYKVVFDYGKKVIYEAGSYYSYIDMSGNLFNTRSREEAIANASQTATFP